MPEPTASEIQASVLDINTSVNRELLGVASAGFSLDTRNTMTVVFSASCPPGKRVAIYELGYRGEISLASGTLTLGVSELEPSPATPSTIPLTAVVNAPLTGLSKISTTALNSLVNRQGYDLAVVVGLQSSDPGSAYGSFYLLYSLV
jgi:hypothetical protein